MTDKQKVQLANMVLQFISDNTTDASQPTMIGTLNRVLGFNGFKKAEVGTPIFEFNGKYIIYMESLDGKRNIGVTYNKEQLAPVVDIVK